MFENEDVKDDAVEEDAVADQPDTQDAHDTGAPDVDGSEEHEVVVTIGDEPIHDEQKQPAPEWVRDLRKQHRELQKRNRELEEQIRAKSAPVADVSAPGVKPTLEGCDYDAEKFEADLAQWYERKRKADEAEAKANSERADADRAWQAKLAAYGEHKAALKVQDYDEAEAVTQETLSQTQQGIIVQGAENPALVVYAIGKNPAKAKELAAITDPVKYTFAIAKLEAQLKVSKRSSAPPPEKQVHGSGPISSTIDSHLDRLRAEAEKTGDYTKVTQYRMQKRAKAA
jgi:hypothetical protein